MNYTDSQLKHALARMLPETTVTKWNGFLGCKSDDMYKRDVYDTELLHLCWLVEEELTNPCDYATELKAVMLDQGFGFGPSSEHYLWHATRQQRVIALAKVKGIEI